MFTPMCPEQPEEPPVDVQKSKLSISWVAELVNEGPGQ